ncbi:pfkB family carbohydrate kinase like protein [Zymoseptoria brevis]|uniref:PfkB family carbohydrate kinase like protein n=1 Tax=Zymoseptoria brevis TaxID=1047168 RepID=A0A0F4GR37_9PEZI|nr:pfkB family carbohydrate kinase like protein [Zymoseptoria brevis]
MGDARFVSLGGVWLDDIQFGGQTVHRQVLGGSVTFATLGARLFSPTDPSSIRFVIRAGNDFPSETIWKLRRWKTSLVVEWIETFPAARGVLQYEEHDASKTTYHRQTSPLLSTHHNLTLSDAVGASCFHFFDTPDSVKEEIDSISDIRARHGLSGDLIAIWEPQAKSCSPRTLPQHLETAKIVDVFSPNHVELESFFSYAKRSSFDESRVEAQASHFLESGVGWEGAGCIVVRAAEHGCLVMSHKIGAVWLPAVYPSESPKVVDTTGAGNAFLGGFAMGLLESGDFVLAAKYGQVAASFAIEQVGVPEVTGHGEDELWNGQSVVERLNSYSHALRNGRS